MQESIHATEPSAVRFADVAASDAASLANSIEEIYNGDLDVIVIRKAMAAPTLAETGRLLDRNDNDRGWARPNEKMPVEDIQLLGTDVPATPTFRDPRGASLESYLDSSERNRSSLDQLFDSSFKPSEEIRKLLAGFSGGRPVEVPRSADGRSYVPVTLRRLADGKQIGLHHDYHYALALYSELAPIVDTRTLVSYVVTLQRPDTGGELFVYAVTPNTPDAPKMPNGYSWDLEAIEKRFHSVKFDTDAGDVFLLASGRCLHRVGRVAGPRARMTMGGFLAFDKGRERVLFWS